MWIVEWLAWWLLASVAVTPAVCALLRFAHDLEDHDE